MLLLLFLNLLSTLVFSQNMVQISGVMKEYSTNERINGGTIFYLEQSKNVISNDVGFYSLKVKRGDTCTLQISHLAYQPVIIKVAAVKDTFITVSMKAAESTMAEVVVKNRIENTTGSISVPVKQIEKMPSLLGEKDLIRMVQLLPGVQSGNEGSTGFYVRGGGADQNLILLDGITVYNVSHLFGFLSLFPPEAVKSVELWKGGFPARFGGRLSSVLDIKLRDGNQKKYSGNISTGLLSSKVSVEGPLKKDKSSFIITGRRTYVDALIKPFVDKKNTGGYFFYDGIAKLNVTVNNRNRFFISAYSGQDKFYSTVSDKYTTNGKPVSSSSKTGFRWGNFTGSLRWNQILSKTLHVNYAASITQFRYQLDFTGKQNTGELNDTALDLQYSYFSLIKDINIKAETDWYASNRYKIKSGISYTRHSFVPSSSSVRRWSNGNINYADESGRTINADESVFFIEGETDLIRNLKLNIGLHNSIYAVENALFPSLQPRISGLYKINDRSDLRFSYTYMLQPIHLLTNNGPGLPTDLWVPATKKVKPQKAYQYSLGYRMASGQAYEFSLEAYYKRMRRIIEYIEGANFLNTALNWEDKVEAGSGDSYGGELFIQRKKGMFTGWVGYTLSWSNRNFESLNEGQTFFYKYDHRHDFKSVMIYEPKKNLDLSLAFVLHSGNRITLPDVFYNGASGSFSYGFPDFLFSTSNTQLVYNASGRNNYQMKTYHRLDFSINFNKERKRGTRTWNISMYNLYTRLNPYFYYYKQKPDGSLSLTQISVFPIIPSISYTFKWN